jgi:hypothetical protein
MSSFYYYGNEISILLADKCNLFAEYKICVIECIC